MACWYPGFGYKATSGLSGENYTMLQSGRRPGFGWGMDDGGRRMGNRRTAIGVFKFRAANHNTTTKKVGNF